MNIAVETRDLRHIYPTNGKANNVAALKGVSLSAVKGEVFGFLGPNGSGKTTLFRILSTLVAPQSGSAEIFGNDLGTKSDEARKLIGVVFQHPGLDKKLTVEENLTHHGHLYGMRGEDLKRRIAEQLERFGVSQHKTKFIETLSGGMQRRVELAKALLPSPQLLILDEPSTGLDPAARRDLWDTLTSLKKNTGLSVLVTTHLGDEGDKCDTVAIMNEGLVVASGSPTKLKSEIGGDVITILSGSPDNLSAKIRQKLNVNPTVVDGMVRIEIAGGHEFIPKIVEAFPGEVRSVTLGKPALEDVFLKHTGQKLETRANEAAN